MTKSARSTRPSEVKNLRLYDYRLKRVFHRNKSTEQMRTNLYELLSSESSYPGISRGNYQECFRLGHANEPARIVRFLRLRRRTFRVSVPTDAGLRRVCLDMILCQQAMHYSKLQGRRVLVSMLRRNSGGNSEGRLVDKRASFILPSILAAISCVDAEK